MDDLIRRRDIYEKVCMLEKQAIDHLSKMELDSIGFKIWSAILTERTAFKYDVSDCPSIRGSILVSEPLPDFEEQEEREDG